ncbi:MAG TPA: 50S ribosomal protein L21 [Egibacteraceae bacterium]|jgi:large subunit ribosomal protein L21|nr:50S ribosomal protein L21 [Egibacteraceae bacterium]
MYAVIATGGKQYRVRVGDTLDVEKVEPGEDGSVDLRPVLLVDDDGGVKATPDALDGATVRASVVEQRRGNKITVFKYRNKTRYRRKAGHRQSLTRIRVDDITA